MFIYKDPGIIDDIPDPFYIHRSTPYSKNNLAAGVGINVEAILKKNKSILY